MDDILDISSPDAGRQRGRPVVVALAILTLVLGVAGLVTSRPFSAHPTGASAPVPAYVPQTRTYYIAADEVVWDYAPSGINQITGAPFDDTANTYVQQGPQRIGSRYIKSLYREYTDATFTHLKPRDARWQHLGMLGPLIRGVVGDTIKVVYRNNIAPADQHPRPRGVLRQGLRRRAVRRRHERCGQGGRRGRAARDAHVRLAGSAASRTGADGRQFGDVDVPLAHQRGVRRLCGLVGVMIITAANRARPDGTPTDVDREFVVLVQGLE